MKSRLIALLLLPTSLFAATWRVNNTPGTSPDHDSIQHAIDAAEDGDTILIEGSTTAYQGFHLDNKRLNLIGPGYELASNVGTPANKLSAVVESPSQILRFPGLPQTPNGSLIMGLRFQAALHLQGCSNVTVTRCFFDGNYGAYLRLKGPNNTVTQSFFNDHVSIEFGSAAESTGNRIENCLMPEMNLQIDPPNSHETPLFVCYLRNNLIKEISPTSATLVVENNIFRHSLSEMFPNSTFRNNISEGSIHENLNGEGNLPHIPLISVMASYHSGGYPPQEKAFRLSPLTDENPAFNAGTDGTHIGPFGGANPYVLSGVPPLPSIDELSVPQFVAPGADVTIRIKVSNRP